MKLGWLDATAYQTTAGKFDVRGYPSIKVRWVGWFRVVSCRIVANVVCAHVVVACRAVVANVVCGGAVASWHVVNQSTEPKPILFNPHKQHNRSSPPAPRRGCATTQTTTARVRRRASWALVRLRSFIYLFS